MKIEQHDEWIETGPRTSWDRFFIAQTTKGAFVRVRPRFFPSDDGETFFAGWRDPSTGFDIPSDLIEKLAIVTE